MKLHLGCGGTYLDGYINIDFPTTDKTIMNVNADIYQDIRTLEYAENSIDEVRNHHVFEHFNRVDALKILLQWRKWLKVCGKLVVETPDYFWCNVLYPFSPHKFKMRLARHIFGTQEDFWANHLDFWDKGKFKRVLTALGFENLKFSHPIYRNLLPNIKVECYKTTARINENEVVREILEWYVLPAEDKQKFLKAWQE